MKSIWSRLTGNAIVRFCFSHMLILLLVTLSCFAGFQSAFRIVQKIIIIIMKETAISCPRAATRWTTTCISPTSRG